MIALPPAFRPGSHLPELAADLLRAGSTAGVVVVDDGSPPADSAEPLDAAERLGCTVLRHATNLGKGIALKTGLRHIADAFPGEDAVSADADGQHSVADIE